MLQAQQPQEVHTKNGAAALVFSCLCYPMFFSEFVRKMVKLKNWQNNFFWGNMTAGATLENAAWHLCFMLNSMFFAVDTKPCSSCSFTLVCIATGRSANENWAKRSSSSTWSRPPNRMLSSGRLAQMPSISLCKIAKIIFSCTQAISAIFSTDRWSSVCQSWYQGDSDTHQKLLQQNRWPERKRNLYLELERCETSGSLQFELHCRILL